jgi:hypothetical protein
VLRVERARRKIMNIVVKTVMNGAGLSVLLLGCGGDMENKRATTPPSAQDTRVAEADAERERDVVPLEPLPSDAAAETRSATDSIAEARCAREATCDNIGDGKRFSSAADCMSRIR